MRQPEVKQRFRIVVLHHPPYGNGVPWHKRLLDARRFVDVLARAGAELVLHGHLHRDLRDDIWADSDISRRPVPVIGVNSGSWMSPDPARRASYNLYRIEAGELVEIRRRRYAAETSTDDAVWCES